MTLNEYQKLAMTTCMESCKNDTYMLFGLMAEVGGGRRQNREVETERNHPYRWEQVGICTG